MSTVPRRTAATRRGRFTHTIRSWGFLALHVFTDDPLERAVVGHAGGDPRFTQTMELSILVQTSAVELYLVIIEEICI